MFALNEQVKQIGNIIFNTETTIKNIRLSNKKKRSLRRTLNFRNRWDSPYEIPEMANLEYWR